MSYGDRPRVTPTEFHYKVRSELANKGWTTHQINTAEAMLHNSLIANPHLSSWKAGIDEQSKEQHLEFMRNHKDITHLGDHRLAELGAALDRQI
jgi:hypothetical protein